LAFYDITNEKHIFAIHMIFKYLSVNHFAPNLDNNFNQINYDAGIGLTNITTRLPQLDKLYIKMQPNGRLLR